MTTANNKYDIVILREENTNCACDIRSKFFCRWDQCRPYGINIEAGIVEPLEAVNTITTAIISSDEFASKEKRKAEEKNVRLIQKWQKQYGFHNGIKEVLEEINTNGNCKTYCPDRAFFAAYVLFKEGYKARVM